jgi:hypothetical protein
MLVIQFVHDAMSAVAACEASKYALLSLTTYSYTLLSQTV